MGGTLRDLPGGVKPGGLWQSPWFAQAIEQMPQGQDGMGKEHAWPAIAHHRVDALPLLRRVTVDQAVAAGGLGHLEGAVVQPLAGIGQKCCAVRAEVRRLVMIAAVTANHRLHGAGFAEQAG